MWERPLGGRAPMNVSDVGVHPVPVARRHLEHRAVRVGVGRTPSIAGDGQGWCRLPVWAADHRLAVVAVAPPGANGDHHPDRVAAVHGVDGALVPERSAVVAHQEDVHLCVAAPVADDATTVSGDQVPVASVRLCHSGQVAAGEAAGRRRADGK